LTAKENQAHCESLAFVPAQSAGLTASLAVTIESLKLKIAGQGVPALWWIGPRTKPDNIESLLQQHGLSRVEEVPGMETNLPTPCYKPEQIANFTIKSVDTVKLQALWARTATVWTGFSDSATDAITRIEPKIIDPQHRAQYRSIGFLDGKPVSTSALVLDSGVAGI
jgi:hypothetical protein